MKHLTTEMLPEIAQSEILKEMYYYTEWNDAILIALKSSDADALCRAFNNVSGILAIANPDNHDC